MFLEGPDMTGAFLKFEEEIAAFAQRHRDQWPWIRDVAVRIKLRCSMRSGVLAAYF